MIKPEQIPIPPESRMAATDALLQTGGDVVAAIRAAINAWPGMIDRWDNFDKCAIVELPLPETRE